MNQTTLSHNHKPSKVFYFLTITFFVWWLGGLFFTGKDLYLIPLVLFLAGILYKVFFTKDKGFDFIDEFKNYLYTYRIFILIIFCIQIALLLTSSVLSYYSLSHGISDTGIIHNIVINTLKGNPFISYYNGHAFADHFTPSFLVIATPLYAIKETALWLIMIKGIAYVITPYVFYLIVKKLISDTTNQMIVSLILGLGWLFFCTPIFLAYHGHLNFTSFTLPLIALAFYLLISNKKIWFYLIMVFLLGFKENLGTVWVGFGLYLWFNTKQKKEAIFLMAFGTFSIFFLYFIVMPYFRNYLPSWTPSIDPFFQVPQKMIYFIKLLLPFGLLPLVFWRVGIMALPAIAINLVSNKVTLFDFNYGYYHYQDIPSTMLFISMILIFKKKWQKSRELSLFGKMNFFKRKLVKRFSSNAGNILVLVFFVYVSFNLPPSISEKMVNRDDKKEGYIKTFIPQKKHKFIKQEVESINKKFNEDTKIYGQYDRIYPLLDFGSLHLLHKNILDENGNCKKLKLGELGPNEIYIFEFPLRYGNSFVSKCAPTILEDNPHLVRDPSYKELIVLRQREITNSITK